MKQQDIDKDELTTAAIVLHATVGSQDFEKEFPDINAWAKNNVNQEDQNKIVNTMIEKIRESKAVSLPIDDFFILYAYVQAVIGLQETKLRFPKLRSIALNLADDKQLSALLQLVHQIENSIHEKYMK